jgi:hypothetical protein
MRVQRRQPGPQLRDALAIAKIVDGPAFRAAYCLRERPETASTVGTAPARHYGLLGGSTPIAIMACFTTS